MSSESPPGYYESEYIHPVRSMRSDAAELSNIVHENSSIDYMLEQLAHWIKTHRYSHPDEEIENTIDEMIYEGSPAVINNTRPNFGKANTALRYLLLHNWLSPNSYILGKPLFYKAFQDGNFELCNILLSMPSFQATLDTDLRMKKFLDGYLKVYDKFQNRLSTSSSSY
jgi:hypothetical protein